MSARAGFPWGRLRRLNEKWEEELIEIGGKHFFICMFLAITNKDEV
jgi:hypothetical protein